MNTRKIDIKRDRQTLLEFHCRINYESSSPSMRKTFTFEQSRDIWMKSRGVREFLSDLEKSLKDRRTIAEIWEDNGKTVAYIWVRFIDWPEYKSTAAQIMDVMVLPEYRRKRIALDMFRHVEQLARERGATLLRSGTGPENTASQGLHAKFGFKTAYTEYEKGL